MALANSRTGNRFSLLTLKSLQARRKIWLKVHLWLGLSLGLILAIAGLTGAVLVFWVEIDEIINPELYHTYAYSESGPKPLDDLIEAAVVAAPGGWDSTWVQAPKGNGNYIFNFYYPKTNPATGNAQSLTLAIDPFNSEINAKRIFYHAFNPLKHSFVGFFFKLHYALFLGELGSNLMGWFAVVFLISVLTGLILWWPLTGKWKRVLTIKRNTSPERFNYDLHQSAGFYSAIVLLTVLMSGIYFNLPEPFHWLVSRFSPLTPPLVSKTAAVANSGGILQQAIDKIRLETPQMQLQYYNFAYDPSTPFTACFTDVPELKPYILDSRCYHLDRHTGAVLAIQDPKTGSAGDTFEQWQWPLHSGQAFGWPGRIAVFITGLLCPLLFVTGVIRWLQKQPSKQGRKVL